MYTDKTRTFLKAINIIVAIMIISSSCFCAVADESLSDIITRARWINSDNTSIYFEFYENGSGLVVTELGYFDAKWHLDGTELTYSFKLFGTEVSDTLSIRSEDGRHILDTGNNIYYYQEIPADAGTDSGSADTSDYIEAAKLFEYFHSKWFLNNMESYTWYTEYPIIRTETHEYEGKELYKLPDGSFCFLFEPDETGNGISQITIFCDSSAFATEDDSTNNRYMLCIETIAILQPFVIEAMELDPNADSVSMIVTIVNDAIAHISSGAYTSDVISYVEVADVQAYVDNDTAGIIISFDTPVSSDFLISRLYLLND